MYVASFSWLDVYGNGYNIVTTFSFGTGSSRNYAYPHVHTYLITFSMYVGVQGNYLVFPRHIY